MGGGKGLAGEQILVRSTGERIVLKPSETISVKSGDRLILRTPGGGGAGKELSEVYCKGLIIGFYDFSPHLIFVTF